MPDAADEEGRNDVAAEGDEAAHGGTSGSSDLQLPVKAAAALPPVQVVVRLRPLLSWERESAQTSTALDVVSGTKGSVTLRPREGSDESSRTRSFRFDTVLGPEHNQQDVWENTRLERLVDKVVEGFHATVFAYGQTGTGKTYTMEGFAYNHHNGSAAPSADAGRARVNVAATSQEQLGLVPRMIHTLFSRIGGVVESPEGQPTRASCEWTVKVSFLQIYKERIYDLLNPVHTLAQREAGKGDAVAGLRMRLHPTRRHFYVENLFEYECANAEEALEHYSTGLKNKHVASTAMNVASSRSHTILMVTLVRHVPMAGSRSGGVAAVGAQGPAPVGKVVSRLALVDLAGSERAAASNADANIGGKGASTRFQEAVNINQSLFVLRKVITALSKRSSETDEASVHVPYRESKLTSLLQHSIGGNSFLMMLACLSPSDKHYEENLSTLQYASQAANISNAPTVNLDPKDRLIQQLRSQLDAAHAYILEQLGLQELPPELLAVGGLQRRPSQQPQRPLKSSSGRPRRTRTSDCSALGSGAESLSARDAAAVYSHSLSATWTGEKQHRGPAAAPAPHLAREPYRVSSSAAAVLPPDGLTPRRSPRPGSLQASSRPLESQTAAEGRQLFAAADMLLASCASYGGSETPRGNNRPPSLPASTPGGLPPLALRQFRQIPELSNPTAPKAATGRRPSRHSARCDDEDAQRPASTPSTAVSSGCIGSADVLLGASAETGLWEAVEELKEAKTSLEEQLQAARAQVVVLQRRLEGAEVEPSRVHGGTKQVAAESEPEAEAATMAEATAAMQEENKQLSRRNQELQDRLDIFFSAMELERREPLNSSGEAPTTDSIAERSAADARGATSDGLVASIERFHTRLVLEAADLRREVAGLKKKKWVMRAVIAKGGADEQLAIDADIDRLRKSGKVQVETPTPTSAAVLAGLR
eukprot:TRINITY_DN15916_c0_g1_i1.p1 TRINITY_DN15916_c0_g1~~TRINITY_DN15916_c0_g1_i1.p1  ORF type:complete len:936 (-),score=226.83 TRINITY_DN15916_c0_g1_i1:274-3081(-)